MNEETFNKLMGHPMKSIDALVDQARAITKNNTMSRLLLTIDSLNSKKNGEEPHRIVELCTKDLMEHGIERD